MNPVKSVPTEYFVKIVDASVIAHALVSPEEIGNLSRQLLDESSQIVSPDCLFSEVMAALRKMWLRKTISDEVLQCPLITSDVRLANAIGVRCEIELLAA